MSFEPERALHFWDSLDDLAGAIALRGERIRQFVLFSLSTLIFLVLCLGGVLLAVTEPPLALATAVLLLVTLMYRHATSRRTLEISA